MVRQSRWVLATAAILSVGSVLAGCGGGGSESPDLPGTASLTGRFVVRDVTPKGLIDPIEGVPVTKFALVGGSTRGLVAGTLTLSTPSFSNLYGPFVEDEVPVVIDIRQGKVQRLRLPASATTPVLERGAPERITRDGDVFGFLYPKKPGGAVFSYDFKYSRATDQTTAVPSILERRGGAQYGSVNDARQTLGFQNDQWSVVNFDAPETNPQPITPPSGYTLRALYLNNAGEVAGRLYKPSGALIAPSGVFFWTNGVATVLPPLAERKVVTAEALTDDGRVIGTAVDANSETHVVFWQNGQITQLPDPIANITGMRVVAANTRGDILAVINSTKPDESRPRSVYLLFRNGAWIDLSLELSNLTTPASPTLLLEDGRLIGTNNNKLYTLTPR